MSLLDLSNYLLCPLQARNHLLTLLPSSDGVLALFQQVVRFCCAVHVFQQFALHLLFGESCWADQFLLQGKIFGPTYCTRVSMMDLGTMSIIVRRTMLK